MPLNVEAITRALDAQPLCRCALVDPTPVGMARCAVGAMLSAAGVADSDMQDMDEDGSHAWEVWNEWGDVLRASYGFESEQQIRDIIGANDGAFTAERRAYVLMTVQRLAEAES